MEFFWQKATGRSLTLAALLAVFFSGQAHGYANFVAYGYKSCASCHYDPNGNGPLTDYGRALWGSHIADKPFWERDADDEKLASQSHFLYTTPFPKYFRAAIDYRGLALARSLNKDPKYRYITMKLDATVILQNDAEHRYFAVGNLGYIEDSAATSGVGGRAAKHLISRQHYLGIRPTEQLTLLAGFTDVVYGLRIPDHIAFSRMFTNLAQNDQAHGIVAKYQAENWEGTLNVFAGNLYQDKGVRAMGASGQFEYEVRPDAMIGVSALYSKNDFRERQLGGAHARLRLGDASSLLFEAGVIRNQPKTGVETTTSPYVFTQFQTPIRRGLLFLPTGEFYDDKVAGRFYRIGPGLQYFPFQRLELRLDLQAQWQSLGTASTFQLNGMGQAHVSL